MEREPTQPEDRGAGAPTEPLESTEPLPPIGSPEPSGPEGATTSGSGAPTALLARPTPAPPGPHDREAAARARRRRITIAALVAVVALVAGTLVGFWIGGDDDDDGGGGAPGTTSSTVEPSSTSEPSVSTTEPSTTAPSTTASATTGPPPHPDTSTAVFPSGSGGVRYDDPVDAAGGFAETFIGFTDPVVGPFLQGDARSGEVEVRPTARGPATTVFVRQLGSDGSWWVLGSATANIEVDEPDAGDRISSPVTVSGRALAFEGTVGVEVRVDGRSRPIGTGVVTGGGDEMRPFEGEITFPTPRPRGGALVFLTRSEMDGRVWEAAVLRVTFR